eukprot:443244-Pyramimonas_sp.AAC.1
MHRAAVSPHVLIPALRADVHRNSSNVDLLKEVFSVWYNKSPSKLQSACFLYKLPGASLDKDRRSARARQMIQNRPGKHLDLDELGEPLERSKRYARPGAASKESIDVAQVRVH